MSYFFIKMATSEFGLGFNCFVKVPNGQNVAEAVNQEALKRRLLICHDYTVEDATEQEFLDYIS